MKLPDKHRILMDVHVGERIVRNQFSLYSKALHIFQFKGPKLITASFVGSYNRHPVLEVAEILA